MESGRNAHSALRNCCKSTQHMTERHETKVKWLSCVTPCVIPWDSPGQNTGVGSVSLLQGIFWPRNQTCVSCTAGRFFSNWAIREALMPLNESESRSVVSDSLQPHGFCPWNSPGQNTRVGTLALLQGNLPTQGSNPGLPYCRQIFYQLSHKGSLKATF